MTAPFTAGLIIVGAGGHGRELAWLAAICGAAGTSPAPVAFVDDNAQPNARVLHGLEVLDWHAADARFPGASLVLGIGDSSVRTAVAQRLTAEGRDFAKLVHPAAEIAPSATLGQGCVVCAGSVISVDVTLGDHVHVNRACQVGHDTVLGDFVTLLPGVVVGGNVRIGIGAMLGAGAVVRNGSAARALIVGERAMVGMGAVVVRDVPAATTVMGVPANER